MAVDLALLPDGLLTLLIGPSRSAAPDGAGTEVTPAIPEGQRNDRLYRLGRSLVAQGLAPEAVRAALQAENLARCRPPLSEREVREIAEHVITQPDRPDFQATRTDDPNDGEPGRPLGIGLGEFLGQEFPPNKHLIEEILSDDGGGWIAGEEKLGKTFYALEEALCLALGLPVCGRFKVPHRQRVHLIEEEDSPRRTHGRLRALLRGHDLDPDDPAVRADLNEWFRIEVWRGFSLDNDQQVLDLAAACEEFHPAVVYLDVLRKITTCDLNKANEAGAVLAKLDDLRRRYGVIFRLIHHYRKSQGQRSGRGSQEMSGSFVLGAWGENSIFFEPVGRTQGPVRVTVQSKDSAPTPPFALRLVAEGPRNAPTKVVLVAEDLPTQSAEERLKDQVIEALTTLTPVEAVTGKSGVPLSAIVEALHRKSDKPVRKVLKALQDDKRVEIVGKADKQADLFAVIAQ